MLITAVAFTIALVAADFLDLARVGGARKRERDLF